MSAILNAFGRVDERAMHEQFEELCGGSARAFRLMHFYRDGHFRSNEAFIKAATREGFTKEQCSAFLSLP